MRNLKLTIVAALVVLWAGVASASIVPGDWVKLSWVSGKYRSNGGAFDVTVYGSDRKTELTDKHFHTFCTELTQNINLNTQYRVAEITTQTTESATLDDFGQWLFAAFSKPGLGVVDGLPVVATWDNLNPDTAGLIQYGIWSHLMKNGSRQYADLLITSHTSPKWTQPVLDDYAARLADGGVIYEAYEADLASQKWINEGGANVRILQLVSDKDAPAQDQATLFAFTTGGVTAVPEPTTIAIWGVGLGLAGAAALRRRKQPQGRWSNENRQAIFAVIEGKR